MHSVELDEISKIVCLSILLNCCMITLLDFVFKNQELRELIPTDTRVDNNKHFRKDLSQKSRNLSNKFKSVA